MINRDVGLSSLYNILMYYQHNPDHDVDHRDIEDTCQTIEDGQVSNEELCNSLIKEIQGIAYEMHKNFEKKEAVYKLLDLKISPGTNPITRIINTVFIEDRAYSNLKSIIEALQNQEKMPINYALLIKFTIKNTPKWGKYKGECPKLLIEICGLIPKNMSEERLVIVNLIKERISVEESRRLNIFLKRNAYSKLPDFGYIQVLKKCLKDICHNQEIYDHIN